MRRPAIDPRSVSELVICAVGTDPDSSCDAILELQARPTADVFETLAQLALSDRPAERRVAADVLGRLGWPDWERTGTFAFEAEAAQILRSLLQDGDLDVVKAAARALHLNDDPAAVPALVGLLQHPDPEVRSTVEIALGGRHDPRSDSELISCAIDTDQAESQRAIEALRTRPTADVFGLLAGLARSNEATERRVAARTLGQFGWRKRDGNGRLAFHAEVVQILRSLLHDENRGVVEDATCALSHRPDPAAVSDLVALIEDPDPEIRAAVALALSRLDGDDVLEALFVLIRDSDSDVRGWATFAFKMIDSDSDQIREVLAERLRDEDHDVVLAATEALTLRGDVRAAEGLAVLVGGEAIEKLPSRFLLDRFHETTLLQAYAELCGADRNQ